MNVHRMVMEDRHVDPGIQGSHRPISFIRTKHTWYLVLGKLRACCAASSTYFLHKKLKNVSCEYNRLNG